MLFCLCGFDKPYGCHPLLCWGCHWNPANKEMKLCQCNANATCMHAMLLCYACIYIYIANATCMRANTACNTYSVVSVQCINACTAVCAGLVLCNSIASYLRAVPQHYNLVMLHRMLLQDCMHTYCNIDAALQHFVTYCKLKCNTVCCTWYMHCNIIVLQQYNAVLQFFQLKCNIARCSIHALLQYRIFLQLISNTKCALQKVLINTMCTAEA